MVWVSRSWIFPEKDKGQPARAVQKGTAICVFWAFAPEFPEGPPANVGMLATTFLGMFLDAWVITSDRTRRKTRLKDQHATLML